jgi:hypothetical protein
MKHVRAFLIKFLSSLVLLYIILGLFNGMSFGNVFLITTGLGIAAYVLGDMLILPRTNNNIATVADFLLAFMVIWLLSQTLTYGDSMFAESLMASVGVALFEYFYHQYLFKNNVVDSEEDNIIQGKLRFQTEASEELTPVRPDVRSTEDEK